MEKQLIITMGRECGSAGVEIAHKLGEKLGLKVYEKNIFAELEEYYNIDASRLEKYDEKPHRSLFNRKLKDYSTSPETEVVQLQRQFLKSRADAGESFLVLGRCGADVLKDYPCVIRIFVMADRDFKVARVIEEHGVSPAKADEYIHSVNLKRMYYHNQHCPGSKWGEARTYDITVNVSTMGVDKTVEALESYARIRMAE